MKYTTGCHKKRKNILYFAISILCENISNTEEILRPSQQEIISNILKKKDLVYKQIKKSEESPNTEYLFSNLDKKQTFEESVRRMEMLQSVDFANRNL